MWTDSADVEAVADGLWLRLRDVILAERRLERFSFTPEVADAGVSVRLAALAGDPDALGRLARDVTLRALAAGSDPANAQILSALEDGRPAPLAELASRTGLPGLALAERVGALAQAGLAARDVEADAVLPTAAGRGLASFFDALTRALADRLSRELPRLLGA